MPLPVNKFLPLARLAAFGAVMFLSLIILALSAHILSFTAGFYSSFFDFAALALAVSILSLLSLPVMLYIENIRTGALPSFIIFELGWLGFLWVMWLASAGTTASINITGGRCFSRRSGASTVCSEINVIEAFAFLNWLILLVYYIALLAFSLQAFQRGNSRVWFGAVKDTDFEGTGAQSQEKPYAPNTFAPQYPPSNIITTPYEPQPQHQQYQGTPVAAQV